MSSTTLRQLLKLMQDAVESLEATCKESGSQIPNLNDTFHPDSEAFRLHPGGGEAARVASAAALQLAAILMPPHLTAYRAIGGQFKAVALRACLETHVTEILREAGPQGLEVSDIAAVTGQDPSKLGRFLRILATNYIYREIEPNRFTNNRVSSMLDSQKSVRDILANPEAKFSSAFGFGALAGHHLDETFKASAYAWDLLADTRLAHSVEPTETPLAKSIGANITLWDYYARPEETLRQKRFDLAMHGIRLAQPSGAVLRAFDWETLPAQSLVVDVGGGIGVSTLELATKHAQLKYVVQDRPGVIEEGREHWLKEMPYALTSGKVQFQGMTYSFVLTHDFFDPQPQRNTSVFLLKSILHDWSDPYCLKILTRLREAATPDTKLLLLDSIVPYACRDTTGDGHNGIPGAAPEEAPAPLLANYGPVNEMVYNVDIVMFLMFCSQERTVLHMQDLLRQTGWEISAVRRQPGDSSFIQSIEARPM